MKIRLGIGSITALFVVTGLCAGCSQQRHEDVLEFLRNHEHLATATEYRIGIPDEISISAPRVLEIDEVRQTVGVDGKLSLRLLGQVRVAGMTPRQIGVKLEELLKPFYEDPKVHVEVTRYVSQKYYVFGDVARPGYFPYTGKDSVIDALSAARPTFTAWRSRIRVIRPSPDPNKTVRIRINLDEMIKKGDIRLNLLLEPGDIVYVPPTVLGWIGHRVRELLYPLSPVIEAYSEPADLIDASDEYSGNTNN